MSLRTLSRVLLPALALALVANTVRAEVRTETVRYQDGDAQLQGYLTWDDAFEGKRPGIIVVHEWWGLNDYVKRRAEMLAELGYVAFAVDMYGTGKVTEHGNQAKEWMQQITANIEAWQRRALLGLAILRKHELVDASRTAAIGYCFGGATVMQMAYAGADLKGVVSFHGSLPPASEEQAKRIKASVLVAHGSADGFVPAERVAAFQAALNKAGVDWEMDVYGGTRHGFTNPDAGEYGIENVAYNEAADARSWERMQEFLGEVFE
jgi:dienelactone hydrolase